MNSSKENSSKQCLILVVMDSENPSNKEGLTERIENFFKTGLEEECKKVTGEILLTTVPAADLAIVIANKKPKLLVYFELRQGMVDLYHKKLLEEVGSQADMPKAYNLRPKAVGKKVASSVVTSKSLGKLLQKESLAINKMVA